MFTGNISDEIIEKNLQLVFQPNQICLIDVLDAVVPTVIEKITPSLTVQEKVRLFR